MAQVAKLAVSTAAQVVVQAVEYRTMVLGREVLVLELLMKVLMGLNLHHLAHFLAVVVVVLVKQETPMQKAMAAMELAPIFQALLSIMLAAVAAELMHKAQHQRAELAAVVMVEVTTH